MNKSGPVCVQNGALNTEEVQFNTVLLFEDADYRIKRLPTIHLIMLEYYY